MKYWMSLLMVLILAACAAPSPAQQQSLVVNAENARLTADAAQLLAESQERLLTATAEAPIIHITETAAGMAIQQQYWTITAQSVQSTETAAMTHTAMAWTPTPNATGTAIFAALNAESTMQANNVQRDNLELERQRKNNEFFRLMPGLTFTIIALAFALLMMQIARRQRYQPAQVDARGNVLPIIDVVDGHVTDVDRNPNYRGILSTNIAGRWIENKLSLPATVPAVTPERQDAVTERDQMVDLATRGLPAPAKDDGRKKTAQQEAAKQFADGNSGRFKILDGASASDPHVIDGQILDMLDDQWERKEP